MFMTWILDYQDKYISGLIPHIVPATIYPVFGCLCVNVFVQKRQKK